MNNKIIPFRVDSVALLITFLLLTGVSILGCGESTPTPPVLQSITADPSEFVRNGSQTIRVELEYMEGSNSVEEVHFEFIDPDEAALEIIVNSSSIRPGEEGEEVASAELRISPQRNGVYTLRATAEDENGLQSASISTSIDVDGPEVLEVTTDGNTLGSPSSAIVITATVRGASAGDAIVSGEVVQQSEQLAEFEKDSELVWKATVRSVDFTGYSGEEGGTVYPLVTIRFFDSQGRRAEASVELAYQCSYFADAPCDGTCANLEFGDDHCGTCGVQCTGTSTIPWTGENSDLNDRSLRCGDYGCQNDFTIREMPAADQPQSCDEFCATIDHDQGTVVCGPNDHLNYLSGAVNRCENTGAQFYPVSEHKEVGCSETIDELLHRFDVDVEHYWWLACCCSLQVGQ